MVDAGNSNDSSIPNPLAQGPTPVIREFTILNRAQTATLGGL